MLLSGCVLFTSIGYSKMPAFSVTKSHSERNLSAETVRCKLSEFIGGNDGNRTA